MPADAVLIGPGTSGGSSVTTTAGTSTGGSGNVGVLFFAYDPGVTISTVTDSKSNTWTQQWNMTGTGNCRLACYTCANWTGGASHTATVTFSGSAFPTAALVEATGLAPSGAIDVLVSGAVTGTFNTPVSGASRFQRASGALAQADEVILYCLEANTTGSNGDYTSPDLTVLYSNNDLANFWTLGVGKIVVSSTASQTGTLDVANRSNTSSNFGVISFKAVSSGSTALTGTSSTTAVGIAGPQTAKAATGNAATAAVGTLTASSGSVAALTGTAATTSIASLQASLGLPTTGVQADGTAGSTAPQAVVPTAGGRRRRLGPHPALRLPNLGRFRRTPSHTITASSVTASLTGVGAATAVNAVSPVASTPLVGVAGASATGATEASVRVREGSRRRAGGIHPGPGPYNIGRFFRMRRHDEPAQTAAQAISGVSSAAAVGSVSETRAHALTGVAASAATGNVGAAQAGSASVTAVSATPSVDSVSVSAEATLAGVAAAGSVGDVAAVAGVVAVLSGVQCAADVSNAAPQLQTGVGGTAASGTIGTVSGSTPGTWTPVNTRTSSESWNPFAG